MKKILLFFAAAICAAASWAADVVTATITGKQLTVDLANETKFCAFQMDIALPTGVGVEDVVLNVERLDEGTTTIAGAANGNFEIRYNVLSDGTLRVIAYNLANREIAKNEGLLFTATLDQETSAEISIDNILFVDTEGLLEHRLNKADVEEGAAFLMGDVNGDEDVNVLDIDDAIAYSMGDWDDSWFFSEAACDFDEDEEFTVLDIDDLIIYILGL